jgi:hypothetical protein
MKKKSMMKGVDAMAIKDGYIATPISYNDLCPCLGDKMTKMGAYEMEDMDEQMGQEEDMD